MKKTKVLNFKVLSFVLGMCLLAFKVSKAVLWFTLPSIVSVNCWRILAFRSYTNVYRQRCECLQAGVYLYKLLP